MSKTKSQKLVICGSAFCMFEDACHSWTLSHSIEIRISLEHLDLYNLPFSDIIKVKVSKWPTYIAFAFNERVEILKSVAETVMFLCFTHNFHLHHFLSMYWNCLQNNFLHIWGSYSNNGHVQNTNSWSFSAADHLFYSLIRGKCTIEMDIILQDFSFSSNIDPKSNGNDVLCQWDNDSKIFI